MTTLGREAMTLCSDRLSVFRHDYEDTTIDIVVSGRIEGEMDRG